MISRLALARPLVWLLLVGVACAQTQHAPVPAAPSASASAPAPATADVDATLDALLTAHRDQRGGVVYASGADPVDPAWFGIALVTVSGEVFTAGDAERSFPIQSTAKPFTYGLALADHGLETLLERVGVNATGLPFDSLIASSVRARRRQNPMVSAGALATMATIRGRDDDDKWRRVQDAFARFAGAEVPLSLQVYDFEIANSEGSLALADSLLEYDLFQVPCRPDSPAGCFEVPDREGVGAVVSRYLRSTSQQVSARTLAVMAATLANGGANPVTGERALAPQHVKHVLSAMVTAGLYDGSGEWFSRVGLPAKSGVSGNVIAVVPGRFGVAVYSPLVDPSGNSVRGVAALRDLSERWGLHILAPGAPTPIGASPEATPGECSGRQDLGDLACRFLKGP
ncbi:MAG: glutaminase [Deltaproteobacteria bacterium]|nr:glutaminase [Deltaproteobacteria bacterium]